MIPREEAEKRQAGMSLVEVLVVMVIFAIISAALLMLSTSYAEYWDANRARIEIQQDLRVASARMTGELRQALRGTITLSADGVARDDVTFDMRVWSAGVSGWALQTVQYFWDEDARTLNRRLGVGDEQVIARGVQQFEIWRTGASPGVVHILLVLQRARAGGREVSNRLDWSIQLRN